MAPGLRIPSEVPYENLDWHIDGRTEIVSLHLFSNVNVGNVYRRLMPLRNYLSTFSIRFMEVGKPGSGHESQCNETSYVHALELNKSE